MLEYNELRKNYCPDYNHPVEIDVELISTFVSELERGKSSGPDDISAEHIIYAHPILLSILAVY